MKSAFSDVVTDSKLVAELLGCRSVARGDAVPLDLRVFAGKTVWIWLDNGSAPARQAEAT